MKRTLLITGRISLFLVFLVMLAGAIVRMTGSGMGCPDWPKCFGYYIPPTDVSQLTWEPEHQFLRGQMIIRNEQLLVAQQDFISGQAFESDLWRVYDKHDYAEFNPAHTWIEYINRLFGALSGVPVIILFLLSLVNLRRDVVTFILSGLSLAALGFVAWLGKLVVDGNLIPHSITYHMFGALAVMLFILGVIHRNRKTRLLASSSTLKLKVLSLLVLTLSLIQIYFGTGVREQVDAISPLIQRPQWINELDTLFLIHRSFSILIVLLNGWFIYALIKAGWKRKWPVILSVLIAVEVLAGVVLNYAGFPSAFQPVHLLSAVIIGAVQFYLFLQMWLQPEAESVTR